MTNSSHPDQAQKVKHFLQTYCLLSKDRWAGKPIQLIPTWQTPWVDQFYGTGRYVDGVWKRAYKRSSIFCPKKQGKSGLLSGLALFHLLESPGNEVLVVASTIKQAKVIFEESAAMAEAHPVLRKRLWVRDHIKEIQDKRRRSKLQVISSNPAGASGFNGSVICDEIAEWPRSTAAQLWDRLYNAGAARTNAVFLTISTANHERGEHVGWQQYQHCKRCLADPSLDPTFLPVVYECPPDEWESPAAWQAANPSWGYTIDPEEFRADFDRVKNHPRETNRFKIFRLGIWTGSQECFLDQTKWDACYEDFREEDFYGLRAWVGIDSARRNDLCAWLLTVEKDGKLYLLPRAVIPEKAAERKEQTDSVPYLRWHREGRILFSPGDTIDPAFLIEHLMEDFKRFDIVEARFDPYNFELVRQKIEAEHGYTLAEMRQVPSLMAPPTGEFERQVYAGKVRHNRHPVFDWCIGNAVTRRVGEDQIMIDKGKSTQRVDILTAGIISLSAWMAHQDIGFADASWVSFA